MYQNLLPFSQTTFCKSITKVTPFANYGSILHLDVKTFIWPINHLCWACVTFYVVKVSFLGGKVSLLLHKKWHMPNRVSWWLKWKLVLSRWRMPWYENGVTIVIDFKKVSCEKGQHCHPWKLLFHQQSQKINQLGNPGSGLRSPRNLLTHPLAIRPVNFGCTIHFRTLGVKRNPLVPHTLLKPLGAVFPRGGGQECRAGFFLRRSQNSGQNKLKLKQFFQ